MRLGANEDFSAILEINPDDHGALFARGVGRQWLGKADEAEQDFDRLAELTPDEADDPRGDVPGFPPDAEA